MHDVLHDKLLNIPYCLVKKSWGLLRHLIRPGQHNSLPPEAVAVVGLWHFWYGVEELNDESQPLLKSGNANPRQAKLDPSYTSGSQYRET